MKFISIPLTVTFFAASMIQPVYSKDGVVVSLPKNRVAVLSDGDLESASSGSYSVTIYKSDDLTDFRSVATFETETKHNIVQAAKATYGKARK